MSPGAAVAEHVYLFLKSQIMSGRFSPSTTLNGVRLAKEIGVSLSPVRDAMERLVGERMLMVVVGGGFQMPAVSEKSVGNLYAWHAWLVHGALRMARPLPQIDDLLLGLERADGDDAQAITAITADFFSRVGEAADNPEHLMAIRSAGDRLHALRLGEGCLRDRKGELSRLMASVASGKVTALRRGVATYHQRRLQHLPDLVFALYRAARGPAGQLSE